MQNSQKTKERCLTNVITSIYSTHLCDGLAHRDMPFCSNVRYDAHIVSWDQLNVQDENII